jgi:hypothetical protein
LIGRAQAGAPGRFAPAFASALLLALAVFIRPNIAPFVAVMLAGAGLAALHGRQWPRFAGLLLGFLPVAVMPLHNWYFGGVFVLFSANAAHPLVYVMPPSAYLQAADELLRLDLRGEHVWRAVTHLLRWLSGPSGLYVMVPVHAAAVGILIYVAVRGTAYDFWLRLIAAASLAQHAMFSLFYIATPRYHFLSWLMTFLVVTVWLKADGLALMRRYFPAFSRAAAQHPASRLLEAALAGLQRAVAPTRQADHDPARG